MEKMYSCREVAEHYGVKVSTVWDWIRSGRLGAMRIGKEYRVTEFDLETFEQESRNRY